MEIKFSLHNKQLLALNSAATEILYGGAAGGGKSHLIRVAAIAWALSIPGLQVYLFRRIFPDLVKNHLESPTGFRVLLSPLVERGIVDIVEGKGEIRFSNGSKIFLCHCKDEKDRFKYQGAEIHVLMIDELTHFTESIYRFLRGRVRMSGVKLSAAYTGKFPRILCGSNPGNIGHEWVKRTFVDHGSDIILTSESEGGMLRQYIPAILDDNPSLERDEYRARLRGLGSESLVAAMENGDWTVIDGAYFDKFRVDEHVCEPFEIPSRWYKFRSLDWGTAKPFSIGWWAVSDGSVDGFPSGCMIRYREWYGVESPNVGLKLTARAVAKKILELEQDDGRLTGVADPAIFANHGQASIADIFASEGVVWSPAKNDRLQGWEQLRGRLLGGESGRQIVAFSSCQDSIRTIPALTHSLSRPEDLDTSQEDHAADEWRYACMHMPLSVGCSALLRQSDLNIAVGFRPESNDLRICAVATNKNGAGWLWSVAISRKRAYILAGLPLQPGFDRGIIDKFRGCISSGGEIKGRQNISVDYPVLSSSEAVAAIVSGSRKEKMFFSCSFASGSAGDELLKIQAGAKNDEISFLAAAAAGAIAQDMGIA